MLRDAELDGWLRLVLTPGVGNATARKLLAALGPPEQIFSAPAAALASIVSPRVAAALQAEPAGWRELCATTRDWLAGGGRQLVALGDAGYPVELLQTADPPPLLHLEGEAGALLQPLRIAIVGSRNPTHQGAQNAHDFARALAEAGACIVSGLALGIDAAAHEGALAGGGLTVAVVGTGLDRIYPRQHLDLARRIAAQGALLSEYPLGTPPIAPNFPKRNRIISGLCQGTLVVEASLKSGSLITAREAAEQGREVFAVPGAIHSPQSRGCHALIREGAKLVESAQDLLDELRPAAPQPPDAAKACAAADGDPLLEALGWEPCGFDALQARCGWDTPALQARLLELELDGGVARLPGGLLQRVAQG